MGWGNPVVPWSEIARRLSDGRPAGPKDAAGYPGADGGDSPAWTRHRQPYEPPPLARSATPVVPYAELHCHSNFSFLDGASHPEELVEEAVRLGLESLALTDHDGFYGVVRFAEAARAHGLRTVFGAELTLDARTPRAGGGRVGPRPDPDGQHLLILARGPAGYARLARAISAAQMAGHKGLPRLTLGDLAPLGGVGTGDPWLVLTGGRKGTVPRALVEDGPAVASARLGELVEVFGPDNVVVELWDHGDPLDSARNDALAALAVAHGVGIVATNAVHYATRPASPWPRPWPRCAPGAPSTTSTVGCRPAPRPTCARAPSRPAASPATPAPSSGRPSWAASAPSTCSWWPPSCPTTPCPRATPR